MRKNKLNKGFTLAEVLLTLTIVGVVASITIPSIKANVDKAGYVAGVRKAYSVLQQAFAMAQNDNGGVIDTVFGNNTADALNAFVKNMNVSQNCETTANSTCIYNSGMKSLDESDSENFYSSTSSAKAILSDGMIIILNNGKNYCNNSSSLPGSLNNSVCGSIIVDINGFKLPNKFGRDVFAFWIAKTGIYPFGGTTYDDPTKAECNHSGTGCAARVIQEGAMNY